MKLIDDKGRLFGKINVIDFLVILFLLGLTPIFYYGYKIATYKPQAPPPPPLTLQEPTYKEFEVLFKNIPEKFLPLIKEGDQHYVKTEDNKGKKLVSEIIEILGKNPSKVSLSNQKTSIIKQNFELKDYFTVKVLMKLLVTPVENNFIYQGNVLGINSGISFSTDKYILKGFISTHRNPRNIRIMLQINNLIPEIVAIIKKGDKEASMENGTAIAEIVGILEIESAKMIRFHEGETKQYENPFYRDITLDVTLLTEQIKDEYFFKDRPVKIGETVSFSTKKYSLAGTIVNILIE